MTFYLLPFTFLLALALRLLVWRWHEFYPPSGDENEYFNQALTLLRDHRYVELQLMRPPLYTVFLGVTMYVFDSLVQRVRLVQEIISALTVVPMYALTAQLFRDRRAALVAALLVALNYTLAAHATELLSETLFVFGLTVFLWLLCRTNDERRTTDGRRTDDDERRRTDDGRTTDDRRRTNSACAVTIGLAGVALGALVLVRSVALPLLPLGMLWLLQRQKAKDTRQKFRYIVLPTFLFTFAFCLVILPWTARNYVTYGALILVDTTGAENLWLDNNPASRTPNDPLGREAAKSALYALKDDRAARQRLATANGIAQISSDPGWFTTKMWGETQKFFALEYFDDLRERRAIWVPPAAVWLRLVLGDGMWLVLLVAGTAGLARTAGMRDARWLFVLWIAYVFVTNIIFHVELRYRLPLYPALIPFAAFALTRSPAHLRTYAARRLFAGLVVVCALVLTLLHRNYAAETWRLANKHAQLWQAERALTASDAPSARQAAQRALVWDSDSALAEVALARAALISGDRSAANTALNAAIAAVPAHPQPHLLRGALLRAQGNAPAARAEFTKYEAGSLQDLQSWAWDVFAPLGKPPTALNIGDGLDLGFVRGFFATDTHGFRWSQAESQVRINVPASATRVELTLAGGRPTGVAQPRVVVLADGRALGSIQPTNAWHTYSLPLAQPAAQIVLTIQSDTFRPRDTHRASGDARALGVQVQRVEIQSSR